MLYAIVRPLTKAAIAVVAALSALFSASVGATIIEGSVTGGNCALGPNAGTFVKLDPSAGPTLQVGQDNFDTCNLYAFDEDQNTPILNTDLSVDWLVGENGPGVIPVGTIVASHYVFFDPKDAGSSQRGFVVFDAPVFAIISSSGNLSASDYLANTNVEYLGGNQRGLETGDSVTVDTGDPNQINVSWSASSPGDYVRVLTERSPAADVPLPGTLMLLAPWLLLATRRKWRG